MGNEGPMISSAPLTDELKRKGEREVIFFEDRGGGGVGEIGRSEVRERKGGRLLQVSEEKGGREKNQRKKQRKNLRRGKREGKRAD